MNLFLVLLLIVVGYFICFVLAASRVSFRTSLTTLALVILLIWLYYGSDCYGRQIFSGRGCSALCSMCCLFSDILVQEGISFHSGETQNTLGAVSDISGIYTGGTLPYIDYP